jgi:hypothetical protein
VGTSSAPVSAVRPGMLATAPGQSKTVLDVPVSLETVLNVAAKVLSYVCLICLINNSGWILFEVLQGAR